VAPGHAHLDVDHLNVPGARIFGDCDGAVLFVPSHGHPGIFEMHYLFTEAKRGKVALDLVRGAITVMFTEHDATDIGGAVPREHRGSRVMTRALGFLPVGSHTDGGGRDCIVYAMERKSWLSSLPHCPLQ
jgi:hypothetical protein